MLQSALVKVTSDAQGIRYFLNSLQGAHLGYAFKHGPQGLGYYLDEGQVGKGFIEARERSLLERSWPGGSGSSENAPPGLRRQDEEMEIDIND